EDLPRLCSLRRCCCYLGSYQRQRQPGEEIASSRGSVHHLQEPRLDSCLSWYVHTYTCIHSRDLLTSRTVGIPCIPPGGICCSDGIHYAMPPDTCPDGTEPVATAIPGSDSSSTSTLTTTLTSTSTSTSISTWTSTSTSTSITTPSPTTVSSTPVYTPSTPSVKPSSTPASSASVSFIKTPTPSTSSPPLFTGAASSLRAGAVMAGMGAAIMAPAVLAVF
ncbi:hypothetical protein T310_5532, partial [Rasamsonia emersonii CBS 393.64]